MKQTTILALITFSLFTSTTFSQNSDIEFGLKGGVNYAKFTPNPSIRGIELAQYQRKFGFYVGGYSNFTLSEKFKIQPELLFALQGSVFLIEDIEIRESADELPIVGDFKTKITETTISVPVVAKYYVTNTFYLEAGPQFGFIINREDKVIESLSDDPNFNTRPDFDYDIFDFGVALGVGLKLTEQLSLNSRYFIGLIKRDDSVKSSVFNLGVEYGL
tara:strand:+ start:83341 stop:83991 length:651 start_codon:yes stop_codon:yes gene_type:complete